MTHDPLALFASEWDAGLAAVAVSVLLVSLTAAVGCRGLRNSPTLRHTMLLSALAACLTVPLVALVVMLTRTPLVALPLAAPPRWQRALPVERDARQASPVAAAPSDTFSDALDRQMHFPPEARLDDSAGPESTSSSFGAATPRTSVEKRASAGSFSFRVSAGALAQLAWLLGACTLAAFGLRSLWKVHRIRRRAINPKSARHAAIAEAAAAAVGLNAPPEILHSADVATPAVVGFWRPVVLLPAWTLETVSDDDLLNILLHELAHVRRRDQWTLAAQLAARSLFWPVATIHWLNRELARAREEVCDNFVLAHRDAIEYGEVLLRLARLAVGRRQLAETMGILNWRGELEGRVTRILDPRASRETDSPLAAKWLLASVFLVAGSVLCATRFVSAQAPAKAPTGQPGDAKAAQAPAAPPARSAPKRPTVDSLGDPLPEGALLRLGTLRFHAPNGGSELALSPDGKTIVTASDQLIAWDAATGKERWRANADEFALSFLGFLGSRYGSRAVAFSNDSSEFCTPGPTNEILIWDAARGSRKIVTVEEGKNDDQPGIAAAMPERATRSIDVTPDGKKFAIGSPAGMLVCNRQGERLFVVANGANAPPKFDNDDRLSFFGPYSYGRFSPDGKIMAVVVSDRPEEISLYDVETGRELRKLALAKKLVRLDFSPDGKQLVATERDNAVRLYNVDTGERVWSHVIKLDNPYENYTSAVAFTPDGKTVAACATDNRIYLLDAATGDERGRLAGHHWYPWALAFAEDGKLLYSWGWDGPIRRWDVPARKQLPLSEGVRATGVITASPDGQTLAYEDDSGAVRLAATANGAELRKLQVPGMGFSRLLFSPDGRRLAGGGGHGDEVGLVVWDVASGQLLRHWKWPKGRDPHSTVESLSFTSDGRRLAAAVFRQSAAYVWDVINGERLAELKHQEIFGLSFSPDGQTLATAGWDSIVRFWNADAWTVRREFKIPETEQGDDLRVYAVCYSPEGGLLATAHLSGTIRIWAPDTTGLLNQFKLQGRINPGAIAFSPDGLWLATGAQIGAVELWDPITGKKLWDRGRHRDSIDTLGFGRDGGTLVSGGGDGVCYLWDLRPQGVHPAADLAPLWDDLAGNDPVVAYRAMWTLAESPDRAVALLNEKLRLIKSTVDFDRLEEGDSPEESERKRRLMQALVDKDPEVETVAAVRRGVALLVQLGTSEAAELLAELATREEDIGTLASRALKRLEVAQP